MSRTHLFRAAAVFMVTFSPTVFADSDAKSPMVQVQGTEQTPIPVVQTQAELNAAFREMVKDEVKRQLDERLKVMFEQQMKELVHLLDEFRAEQKRSMETALDVERMARAKDILAALDKLNALDIAIHQELRAQEKELTEQEKELLEEREERIKLATELRAAIAKNEPGLIESILRWVGKKADSTFGTGPKAS